MPKRRKIKVKKPGKPGRPKKTEEQKAKEAEKKANRVDKRTLRKKRTRAEKTHDYFQHLTEDELIELDFMFNSGMSVRKVALEAQAIGLFPHITPRTLGDRLWDYKKYVFEPKILGKIENIDVYSKLLALKGDVDVIDEYTHLIQQQKERLQRRLKFEQLRELEAGGDAGKLADSVRREIKMMGDLLEKLAKIQLETGAIKRAPKTINFTRDDEAKQLTLTENYEQVLDAIDVQFDEIKSGS